MAVLHDLQCVRCGRIYENELLKNPDRLPHCRTCKGPCEILYVSSSSRTAAVHKRERTVVWRHPQTGKVAYPGRNDVPMPERYRNAGYERVEMNSLHDLDRFSTEQKVINHQAHYNSGNGPDD